MSIVEILFLYALLYTPDLPRLRRPRVEEERGIVARYISNGCSLILVLQTSVLLMQYHYYVFIKPRYWSINVLLMALLEGLHAGLEIHLSLNESNYAQEINSFQ